MNATWWLDQSELDEHQASVIELPLDGHYLVTGPPGSGKTNLLLLRAKFLTLANLPNVVVVVLTRALREFVAGGAAKYALDNRQVVTSRWFYGHFLKSQGYPVDRSEPYEASRATNIQKVAQVIADRRIGSMYDAILLDEAQDYLPEELDIFQSLSRRIFAVADSRQRIYDSADSIDALRDFTRVKLEAHYRNGLAICQLADAVAIDTAQQPTLVECSNYDEQARPSTVNDRDAASLDEQCRSAIDLISIELKAYPGEPVGVLTPRRDDAEHIVEVLRQSPLKQNVAHVKDDGALDGTTGHRVIVSTIHSAKGLEFRTVHVLNANRILGFANERNLVFTAITRAKTTLTIHHSGPLPPYLRSALLRNSPVPPLNVRDVFGERR